jgi:hypothetical protein
MDAFYPKSKRLSLSQVGQVGHREGGEEFRGWHFLSLKSRETTLFGVGHLLQLPISMSTSMTTNAATTRFV